MFKRNFAGVVAVLVLVFFAMTFSSEIVASDWTKLALEGSNLSSEEVEGLEKELQKSPDNLSIRAKLLGYCSGKRFFSDIERKKYQQHVMYIIQNYPSHEIAGSGFADLDPILDGEVYCKAKELWLQQVKTHPKNTAILGNAAKFFLIHDRNIAEDLFKKAQLLEPNEPKWSALLGNLYMLGTIGVSPEIKKENAKKALKNMEKSLNLTAKEIERFYKLSNLASAAFEAGDIKKARHYAGELLNMASQYKGDWNYGNAIHNGNRILGQISLEKGDVGEAKAFLIEAGKTPGSPQLNSSGPNMTLAKELLGRGEKETVIQYLKLCEKFWEMGKDRLKNWIQAIEAGIEPNWSMNLHY